jgi:hypothetical protein
MTNSAWRCAKVFQLIKETSMKWLFAEAHVVIISNNTPFIILHLIRFKQISQNGCKNFQGEPLATSSDDLITPKVGNSLIPSFIQSAIRI